jgi:hypothetical protein
MIAFHYSKALPSMSKNALRKANGIRATSDRAATATVIDAVYVKAT